MINLNKFNTEKLKEEYNYSFNDIDKHELNLYKKKINSKKHLFYIQLICVFCWFFSGVINLIGNNIFSFFMNFLCFSIWSFLSYNSSQELQKIEKEMHEHFDIKIAEEEKIAKINEDLKSLNFFSK